MKRYALPIAAAGLLAVVSAAWAAEMPAEHPVPMEGNTCLYCHDKNSMAENKADGAVHEQWLSSMHGLNSVNCGTCHGDETDFRPASSINDCMSCHPAETETIKRKTTGSDLVCANCHPAHGFPVKSEKKPVHK